MIRGVDVSIFQGEVDWKSLAAMGVRFAYLRCSIGNEPGVDVKFVANAKRAREAGIAVGPYHFAFPLPGLDPRRQAKHAFALASVDGRALGLDEGELLPAFDLEWPPPENWARWKCTAVQIRDWGLVYLDEAARLWGCRGPVYTYPWFWRKLSEAGGLAEYARNPLWMADYSASGRVPRDDERPKIPAPWDGDSLWCWQHDGDGGLRMPNGVDIDFNVIPDELTLSAFTRSSSYWGTPVEDVEPIPAVMRSNAMIDEAIRGYRANRVNE